MKTINRLFLFILFLHINLYANYVATVTATKGNVTIIRDNSLIKATTGIKLLNKDSIKTAQNSKAQIIFQDETIVSIGKNSLFSIKEYLFDDTEASTARFGMIGGAMRTITGKIGKIAPEKFSVSTKTATIGIRGTNFTIVVNDVGSLEAYCTYGEISVSVNGVNYSVLQGFFITIDKKNNVVQKEFSAEKLKGMKKKHFGTTKHNQSKTSKGVERVNNDSMDDKQLNLTINDTTSVVIKDVSEESEKALQQSKTLNATINKYNMENVTYFGAYSTLTNSGNLDNNGDVKLSINFAQDSAILKMGNFKNPNPTVIYRFENVNKSEIDGHQEGDIGDARAVFYGTTGNIVNGDFKYAQDRVITATGEYSAKTFETLH